MALRPAAPTDSTVRAADWSATDLSGQLHERIQFQDLDLSEASGSGVRFVDCTLRGGRMASCELRDSAFENCTFVRCTFFGAVFTGCKFLGSAFDACRFDNLVVRDGDWSFVGLAGADLRGVRISDVRLREADLTGVRARKATLSGCDLSGAAWDRADLTGADLRGSDLSSLDPLTVTLDEAVVDVHQAVTLARNLGLDVRAD